MTVWRPIGVVEREHGGLVEDIGGAQAGRVVRIAFDLGRAPGMAFHQQPDRTARESHGGGKEQGPARHRVLRRMDIRHQIAGGRGFHRAAVQTGQGQRRAHQREELAAAQAVRPDHCLLGELPLHDFLEGLAARQLLQAAPELFALRALQALPEGRQFSVEIFSVDHR